MAGSLLPSAPIERGGRFQGAARSPQWRRRETAVIERCDRSTQYTCFTPSSMHLRRTNTAMFPVLEHDRSASSTVVQSRRRCHPSFGTDMRMRFRGSTLVHSAALCDPPLRRDHLSPRVRHRDPNAANAPRASLPPRVPAKLLSLRRALPIRGGGPVPSSTKTPLPRRCTAPPSMAVGTPIDPRPCRPSPAMGRRRSDGFRSQVMADTWRCPASAETSSEAIDGGPFRSRERTGAARASAGRVRRPAGAKRAARNDGFALQGGGSRREEMKRFSRSQAKKLVFQG